MKINLYNSKCEIKGKVMKKEIDRDLFIGSQEITKEWSDERPDIIRDDYEGF